MQRKEEIGFSPPPDTKEAITKVMELFILGGLADDDFDRAIGSAGQLLAIGKIKDIGENDQG